jgi:two-component system chemotaxis response regulator CheY
MIKDPLLMFVDSDKNYKYIITSLMLRERKYIFAHNGVQALKKYEEEKPDIIFMEVDLPDINGQELLQKFKQDNPSIFVVMVTSNTRADVVMNLIKLGVNGYVQKPLTRERLNAYIAKYNKENVLDELF